MPIIHHVTITSAGIDPETVMQNKYPDGSFAPGDPVFITKNGTLKHQARMNEIDWTKMDARAEQYAQENVEQDTASAIDKPTLFAMRKQAHMRPYSLITQENFLYGEDMEDTDSRLAIEKTQQAWVESIKTAYPDDLFTHWRIID